LHERRGSDYLNEYKTLRSTSAHRFKVSNVTNTVQYTNEYIHVYGPTDIYSSTSNAEAKNEWS